jgi:hypothetical protein
MSVTYVCTTTDRIITDRQVVTCPVCGADRGLRLTTTDVDYPVTGSCPHGHFWDEKRVPADEVMRVAIESAERGDR